MTGDKIRNHYDALKKETTDTLVFFMRGPSLGQSVGTAAVMGLFVGIYFLEAERGYFLALLMLIAAGLLVDIALSLLRWQKKEPGKNIFTFLLVVISRYASIVATSTYLCALLGIVFVLSAGKGVALSLSVIFALAFLIAILLDAVNKLLADRTMAS